MNTENRFTPGLWQVSRKIPTEVWGSVGECGECIVADTAVIDCPKCWGTRISNAHLIAAAPDMYAAMKGAREYVGEALSLRRAMFAGHEGAGNVEDIEACLSQIDAALAKAEGES